MTIAVIIPTYNRAELLAESLKSIARQTRPADFVLVVDDGSTDNTDAVVESIRREFFETSIVGLETRGDAGAWPYFRYIRRTKNGGKSAAVNEALEDLGSAADLVWIFDDDDIADPKKLELCVPFFEEDPDLDVLHTSAEWRENLEVDGNGQVVGAFGKRAYWMAEACPSNMQARWFLHGCRWFGISVIWRRSILERLNRIEGYSVLGQSWPFDEALERAQDYDFWYRLVLVGARVKALDRVTVYARMHDGMRGIGHKLDSDAVDRRTLEAEQRIMGKLARTPIARIFDMEVPDGPALVEWAYAFHLRHMSEEAYARLAGVRDEDIADLGEVHHEACVQMVAAGVGPNPDDHDHALAREARRVRDAWRLAFPDKAPPDPGVAAAAAIR